VGRLRRPESWLRIDFLAGFFTVLNKDN